MSKKLLRRVGERGITNAVERCMNLSEQWKKDQKLRSRLRFEQSVRVLAKSIPEEWQDSQFMDELFNACLELLERSGMTFTKRNPRGK
ncbi:MAG: hypothetical protein JSV51_09350 [Candidatus Bathyarchaeota archaeon]|nr:MAG: hypothetical protein JSV51_09350 [Candidatus Bathyarchaeota archaeon]